MKAAAKSSGTLESRQTASNIGPGVASAALQSYATFSQSGSEVETSTDDQVNPTQGNASVIGHAGRLPNFHIALHFHQMMEEYGSVWNTNVFWGEDKHKFFKEAVIRTNHRRPERDLLIQECIFTTLRSTLCGAFLHTCTETSAQVIRIKDNCPAVFESLLTVADRRALTSDLRIYGNVEASGSHIDVWVQVDRPNQGHLSALEPCHSLKFTYTNLNTPQSETIKPLSCQNHAKYTHLAPDSYADNLTSARFDFTQVNSSTLSMAGTPPSKRAKTQGGKQEAEAEDQDVPILSGSSVTQVETPSRKCASASQTQVKKWAPGNPTLNDLSRLAEASVAGYLGYTDTLHLRDLMWSWPIMRGAMVFETILKNKIQVTATSILESSLNDVDAYEYETNIDTLVFNFNNRSEEDKANTEDTTRALTLMFAGTIHHTARALEDVGLLTLEDTELQSQFAKLRIEQSGVKGFFVPAFDKTTLLVPTLGPLDMFREHAMERYSRAYICVRYLLYQTTSLKFAPIKAKLGKNQYFVSGIVHPDRLPSWMGNETVKEFVREDGTEDDEQLSEHINSYLKRKKICLSQDIVDYKHDIRDFEIGPQWRDHLRHELSLPRLRCDFSTLTLIPTALPAAEDPGPVQVLQEGPWIIYDNENPDQVTPWTDVLEVLHSGSKFCIEYSLKVVDTEEDGPYPYEFDGGPIQVYSDEVGALAITENTAAQDDATTHANHPTPCTHIAPAPAQVDIKGKGKGPETPELSHTGSKLSYLQGALTGSNYHGIRGIVTPDKLFGDCKSAESQAWHLGIDVSTPAGIEAFIRKVVGTLRVANVAPKAALNLSGLPGTVRQEIQRGMAAATATTLNADLCENEEDATSMAGFYKMQKLFTGDESQTGPPLDACLTIANAHFDTWHDKQCTLAKYALKSLPTVSIRPLGHQITGFLWMAGPFRSHGQPGDEKTFKPADWIGKWKGVFHTVILDEGHKIRNPLSNIHVAVARLNARHHWFITGTPIQNQSTDILGPLNILWPQINKSL
ncbi:hypothetical protein GMDG_08308 [Pseudogymnoascus destructans 20631-21]|uniref:SNF2 N-terminal domain-containing protein n=1 Tax=Pseudogymnoascus destructans (strain ATCC MYA-4855 / 20631-21) TaxID=658429 RepID=L8G5F5_PSED2|nr:hypothetical protein GMDG_08308 [Pseudogymnoascus destructans 20631-21]